MSDRTTTFSDLVSANLIEIGAGRPRTVNLNGHDLPVLRVANVLDGRIESALQGYISYQDVKGGGSKVSRPGDVVLTTKGTVGRVALMPSDGSAFAYSPQLCFFRPAANGPLRSRFLYYWLKSPNFWIQANSLKGQTDMADFLSLGDILQMRIAVPSLDRQDAVVDILGALDDKIAVTDNIVSRLYALVGISWQYVAASAVDHRRLTDVAVLDKGLSYKGEYLGPSGVPLVNLGNFSIDGRFKVDQLKYYSGEARDRHWVADGDLVIANTDLTQRRDILGQPAIVMTRGAKALVTHHVYAVRLRPECGEERLWVYGALRDSAFRERAVSYATGTTVLALPRDAALSYEIPWSSDSDRRAWSDSARIQLKLAASKMEESGLLAGLRDLLLPKLMSGEIRLRDAEMIVEEAL